MESLNCAILACRTLMEYVDAAQRKMGTNIPVTEMDNSLHEFPKKLWSAVAKTIDALPSEVDTVLLAMGLCGGGTLYPSFSRRVIMPRMDDCISILLHTTDEDICNTKETGHFYLLKDSMMSIDRMRNSLIEKYGEEIAGHVMQIWFDSYSSVDVLDTGLYDVHSGEYEQKAKREAALVNLPLRYVSGSNRIMEKMVSGCWDEQFVCLEPGKGMDFMDFMEKGCRVDECVRQRAECTLGKMKWKTGR